MVLVTNAGEFGVEAAVARAGHSGHDGREAELRGSAFPSGAWERGDKRECRDLRTHRHAPFDSFILIFQQPHFRIFVIGGIVNDFIPFFGINDNNTARQLFVGKHK